MKKRMLCMLLSLCLLAGFVPAAGLAAGWSEIQAGQIGFHYGSGSFLKITMPAEVGEYTYGTVAGEVAAQTAANVSVLPESGWQWAVKKEEDGTRMILNDFDLSFDGQTDGLMLNCQATLELRGTNRIAPAASCAYALINTNDHDLTITGTGSLTVCATETEGVGIDLDCSTLTIRGGTVTVAGGNGGINAMRTESGVGVNGTYSYNFDGSNPRDYYTNYPSRSYKWLQFKWEPEKDYAISVSQSADYLFPVIAKGYTDAPSLSVEIANIGGKATGDLSVTLSGEDAARFVLSKTAISDIPVLEGDSFTVQPKPGLDTGSYKATVTVSGSNIEAKSLAVSLLVRSEEPVKIGTKTIRSVDDLKAVASSTGAFTVSEADGIVTVKLLRDIEGRLDIDYKDAHIIIDANDKLLIGNNTNQPITLEHHNNITVELTGNGIYAPGRDSTIFVGIDSTLIIHSATVLGKLHAYSSNSIVKFALEDGSTYYTVTLNGKDLDAPYYKAEKTLTRSTGDNDILLVRQWTGLLPGDMNGDVERNTDDAVYLLLNVMFGATDYPIANGQDKDVNNDGTVDTDDAVYLLLHVMFGAKDYPI